jgi:hypothetical protein
VYSSFRLRTALSILVMEDSELDRALQELFDKELLYHGFTNYMRDYELVVYQSVDPNHLRRVLQHRASAPGHRTQDPPTGVRGPTESPALGQASRHPSALSESARTRSAEATLRSATRASSTTSTSAKGTKGTPW